MYITFLVVVQLLYAVKQSHENGVCHGELSYFTEIALVLIEWWSVGFTLR